MSIIRLTREFEFEMAHNLRGYQGLCRHIHGHSYKLFVTVAGEPSQDENSPFRGMVMDFGELKKIVNSLIVNKYDHALLMLDCPEYRALVSQMKQEWDNILLTEYQPTCENMVIHFANILQKELPKQVKLVSLKLYETARSSAEWRIEDNIVR